MIGFMLPLVLFIGVPGKQTESGLRLESGYEIPAAIVYERRGSWFRIRLEKGSGWVSTSGRVIPLPDDLWIQIPLVTEGPCDEKLEGVTPMSGWIPAYQPNRSPSVWFSSRGC